MLLEIKISYPTLIVKHFLYQRAPSHIGDRIEPRWHPIPASPRHQHLPSGLQQAKALARKHPQNALKELIVTKRGTWWSRNNQIRQETHRRNRYCHFLQTRSSLSSQVSYPLLTSEQWWPSAPHMLPLLTSLSPSHSLKLRTHWQWKTRITRLSLYMTRPTKPLPTLLSLN